METLQVVAGFLILYILLSIYKKQINKIIWMCPLCYTVTIIWSILLELHLLENNIPTHLLFGLIGMSYIGIWHILTDYIHEKYTTLFNAIITLHFLLFIEGINTGNYFIIFSSLALVYATDLFILCLLSVERECRFGLLIKRLITNK